MSLFSHPRHDRKSNGGAKKHTTWSHGDSLESPLSVKEHISWSYQPLHIETSALHDDIAGPPGSVVNADSLKFDFNEVVCEFPTTDATDNATIAA